MNDPRPLLLKFQIVIGDVRRSLGNWGLTAAVGFLLVWRLGRVLARMEVLITAFQAGKVWRRGPRKVAAKPVAPEIAPQIPPEAASPVARDVTRRGGRMRVGCAQGDLPTKFGWLVWAVGWRAAGYGCQLRALLEDPEMVALLKACPAAARTLRPLCRMFAIETSLLTPGVPVPEKVPVEKQMRVRKPRPKPDIGRVPIPRGVMSAVRRGRYGKIG